MRTIHKYPFQVNDEVGILMPFGAVPLCVQMQMDKPCIWAMVETENSLVPTKFVVFGTGHDMERAPEIDHTDYVGTFQLQGGALVFHLFIIR